jgi:hypothetical protein
MPLSISFVGSRRGKTHDKRGYLNYLRKEPIGFPRNSSQVARNNDMSLLEAGFFHSELRHQ